MLQEQHLSRARLEGTAPNTCSGQSERSSASSSPGTAGPGGSSWRRAGPCAAAGISAAKHLAPPCAPRVYGRTGPTGPGGVALRMSSGPARGADHPRAVSPDLTCYGPSPCSGTLELAKEDQDAPGARLESRVCSSTRTMCILTLIAGWGMSCGHQL